MEPKGVELTVETVSANRIKVVDLMEYGLHGDGAPSERTRNRTVLMNGPDFHTWINVYKPGSMDEMHCHNADQTFYCVTGECTLHFPDRPDEVLTPGKIALMPGGHFYQLHNTGTEELILLGSRALNFQQSLKIDYETRKPLNEGGSGRRAERPSGTKIFV
jgi:mannose-6-phosphate isomerase-like protein (cupin superfamily)